MARSIKSKIALSEIQTRITSHLPMHYLTIYTVMKGVTLANAAYTAFTILNAGIVKWQLVPFWLASFTSVILTYDATMVGLLVIAWLPRWQDIVFPFGLIIIEFLLFSVLQSELTLKFWFLIMALFCANASAVVWHVSLELKAQYYEARLSKLINEYRQWMRRDRTKSFSFALFWLVVFFLIPQISFLQNWQWIFGIVGMVQMVGAISDQEYDRRQVLEYINQLSKTGS